MVKLSFLKKYQVLIVVILFILGGCNNEKATDPPSAAKQVKGETNATATAGAPIAAGLTGGKLDSLWITAPEFKLLTKNKAVFIFYFGTLDTVTVHGWEDKGGVDPFSTPPNIKFLKGNPDPVLTYGPGTYFGNLVVNNVNKLIKTINDSLATQVIFAPQLINGHVSYNIFLSKEPHMMIPKILALIPTGVVANPSPPKVYQ